MRRAGNILESVTGNRAKCLRKSSSVHRSGRPRTKMRDDSSDSMARSKSVVEVVEVDGARAKIW
jgi:hypothetical protein